jgi:catechol 2,3-dioxygenase-like lactoylglutathione lyase family enzyme
MKQIALIALASVALAALISTRADEKQAEKDTPMQLGNFCMCLAVKDIKVSLAFYEKLDFKQVGGKLEQNWVVLQNGTTKLGLFQGMLEKNTLNFNPGWDHERKTLKDFQDVREIQHVLKQRGIQLKTEADEKSDGPANFTLVDPDGNPILVDQAVPKPKR